MQRERDVPVRLVAAAILVDGPLAGQTWWWWGWPRGGSQDTYLKKEPATLFLLSSMFAGPRVVGGDKLYALCNGNARVCVCCVCVWLYEAICKAFWVLLQCWVDRSSVHWWSLPSFFFSLPSSPFVCCSHPPSSHFFFLSRSYFSAHDITSLRACREAATRSITGGLALCSSLLTNFLSARWAYAYTNGDMGREKG